MEKEKTKRGGARPNSGPKKKNPEDKKKAIVLYIAVKDIKKYGKMKDLLPAEISLKSMIYEYLGTLS